MAASCDESKVVTPFMPSLRHFASVKIAFPLFQKFGAKTLEKAFSEIQQGNLKTSEGTTAESLRTSRAKEVLLHIPAHLRRGVMEAVHGTHYAVKDWKLCHSYLFHLKGEEHNIHWRSEGSIDAVKTAHNLIRNTKLNSRKRFEIASFYSLEENVKALWAQMEESGETEGFLTSRIGIVHFWMPRMHERSRIPWTLSLIHFLETKIPILSLPSGSFDFPFSMLPRLSTFFPLLRPGERQRCSYLLGSVSLDDFRFCLYSLTKDEEEHVLKNWVSRLLSLHLRWPLQTLFLETAEKLWNYISNDCYCSLLFSILDSNRFYKDFDYSELFERFWNSSPVHLRESARKNSSLRHGIDSFFADKRRKRKYLDEYKS